MRVRFEIDVERAAASFRACGVKGENFGMLHAVVGERTFANDVVGRIGNHRAHMGIRRGKSDALACKFEGAVEKLLVGGVSGHAKRKRILLTARRKTSVRIVFDVGNRGATAAVRAPTQRRGHVGVRVAFRRSWVLTKKSAKSIHQGLSE